MRVRQIDADAFRAEIASALKEKATIGNVSRVACPIETARAVANNRGSPTFAPS